jgi:hypothetical protein
MQRSLKGRGTVAFSIKSVDAGCYGEFEVIKKFTRPHLRSICVVLFS